MARKSDDCVDVYCRKCDKHLGALMPGAEAFCFDCSSTGKEVWTKAVRPNDAK